MSEIVVSDDGVGIDVDAMREFIGTEYCSNNIGNVVSTTKVMDQSGEALKSIAALSMVMKIESRTRSSGGYVVSCTKIIKDGTVVSFESSSNSSSLIPCQTNTNKSTPNIGTTITIRGLFHRHAVRRKQHQLQSREKSVTASDTVSIRQLALAYPLVSFKLLSNKANCTFVAPEYASSFTGPMTCRSPAGLTASSPSLSDEARALKSRLCEVYQIEPSSEHYRGLTYEEGNGNDNLRAFGALYLHGDVLSTGRSKDFEVVLVNGRPATHGSKFANFIQSQVRRCKGTKTESIARFFIQVFCSSNDCELVVNNSDATVSIPQRNKVENFLTSMIAAYLKDDASFLSCQRRDEDTKSQFTLPLQSTRIVKGQSIKSFSIKPSVVIGNKKAASTPKASPFSELFFNDKPNQSHVPIVSEKMESIDFEDAFLDNTNVKLNVLSGGEFDDARDEAAATTWTRKRVLGLEKTIFNMMPETEFGSHDEPISLTKDMLANAEVISQVEAKFIVIKANGKLCVVDQHAADERISLEMLERALFNPNLADDTVIKMTKKKLKVADILKPTQVLPAKRIALTQSQLAAARHHFSLLQKWKFTFEEPSDKSLILTGVPSVCGRVVNVNDFVAFVKELSHHRGGEIKPACVKRILASQACRYAIMFGDTLTHQQCSELIGNLSKCDLCFQCAHGRPSVIPLIDLYRNESKTLNCNSKPETDGGCKREGGNLKSGPTRVIRQRKALDGDNSARRV